MKVVPQIYHAKWIRYRRFHWCIMVMVHPLRYILRNIAALIDKTNYINQQ